MTLYQMVYKCRLCGKVYSSGGTESDITAWKATLNEVMRASGITPQWKSNGNDPTMFEMHHCNDGSYGVADFQGMKHTPDRKTVGAERESEQ